MEKLDDLKPKQIKEEDFDAYVDIYDKKYTWFYKNKVLLIEKKGGEFEFLEWHAHNGPVYDLSLSTVRWLVDKKKINSKRIKLVLKLAGNEQSDSNRTSIRNRGN